MSRAPYRRVASRRPDPTACRHVLAALVVAVAIVTGEATVEAVEPAALQAEIAAGTAPPILDVRSAREFAQDHLPGAHHAPFSDVTAHARALRLDPHAAVVLYCEHGPRAWLARLALRWAGFTDVRLLEGHMVTGRRSGRPVEPASTAPPD